MRGTTKAKYFYLILVRKSKRDEKSVRERESPTDRGYKETRLDFIFVKTAVAIVHVFVIQNEISCSSIIRLLARIGISK